MTDFDFVKEKLGEKEILAQLAEECAELGKAALKLRRAIGCGNPTPVTVEQARENLEEEMADVTGCMRLLGIDVEDVGAIIEKKMRRWRGRLEG